MLALSGLGIGNIAQEEKEKGNRVFCFQLTDPYYVMSYEWLFDHAEELEVTYELFEDDLSRDTFLSFLQDKSNCIGVETKPLWALWTENQYFNSLYPVKAYKEHALVDCGAYDGDTAIEFLKFLGDQGEKGEVYAFEPERNSYELLLKTVEKNRYPITCYPNAVGEKHGYVNFSSNGMGSKIDLDSGEEMVEAVRGDEILKGKPISFVKMDLEGGEADALRGMKDTIVENQPFLAICVYHKIDDIITLPGLITSFVKLMGADYRYYLRHHSTSSIETVFYAVPQKKESKQIL